MARNMRYNPEAERRRRQAEKAALEALRRQQGQAPKQPMPVRPPTQGRPVQPPQVMPPQPPVQRPITQPRKPTPPSVGRPTPVPSPGGSVGGGLPRLPKQPPRQQPPAKKKKPPREPGMFYRGFR